MTPDELLDAAERHGNDLAPGPDVLARAARVISGHERQTWGTGCDCGRKLTVSHATHVAQLLAAEGVLAAAGLTAPVQRSAVRRRSFLLADSRSSFADGAE